MWSEGTARAVELGLAHCVAEFIKGQSLPALLEGLTLPGRERIWIRIKWGLSCSFQGNNCSLSLWTCWPQVLGPPRALGSSDAKSERKRSEDAARIERLSQEKLRQQIKDIRAGHKTIDAEYKVIDVKVEGQAGHSELARIRSEHIKALQATSASPAQLIELERRINLDQITGMVIEEAEAHSSGEPDDKPIEPDWFVQWRNRAQDVSNEDMQRLWARVLKGQAAVSGSYSIHTLEFLSCMSRDDAELLAKLGCFALDNACVYSGSKVLEAVLTFDHILYLADLGLLGRGRRCRLNCII